MYDQKKNKMTKWEKYSNIYHRKQLISQIYKVLLKLWRKKIHKLNNNFLELRTEFTVKELQIALNHMKKYSVMIRSCIRKCMRRKCTHDKKMQTKITLRYFSPIILAKIPNLAHISGEVTGKQVFSNIAVGKESNTTLMEGNLKLSSKSYTYHSIQQFGC